MMNRHALMNFIKTSSRLDSLDMLRGLDLFLLVFFSTGADVFWAADGFPMDDFYPLPV